MTSSSTPGPPPTSDWSVSTASLHDAEALADFAEREPLLWNDFASIADSLVRTPNLHEPRIWLVRRADGVVDAAAIDDGLAMSVGGEAGALALLATRVADLEGKLVIAGRSTDVRALMVGRTDGRRERPEHFMQVTSDELPELPAGLPGEALDLRVATPDDLPLLIEARARALEDEYGVPVEVGGHIHGELERAVRRAVELQGVAIWPIDGRVAFTAQLISKTPVAAMFGDLYTDPALRGAGRATRGLVAFCLWLLSESRHVALRVGVDNTPAVQLYERTGFRTVAEFLTSLREPADDGPGPA